MELRIHYYWYTTTWLVLCVDSSPLSSAGYTTSEVGRQAVLPCTCNEYVADSPQSPYIQWQTASHTVFERLGEERFQGQAYENRVDVPMEILGEGNCSLILSDVQFRDAGIYESYLLVGQSTLKNRILIQTIRLAVFDHKHMQSVERGKDLVLELYTSQAKMLVFQRNGAPEWSVLWQHGPVKHGVHRVEERDGMLVVPGVVDSDSGMYKLVDSEGLALSTVKVSVTESVPTKETEVKEKQISSNSGRALTPPVCLTVILLLSSHALLRRWS